VFEDVPDAVRRCVHVRETIEPNAAWQAVYEQTYTRFGALYPALETVKEHAE
jgi:sugar (pentulose or hexulose) kinase